MAYQTNSFTIAHYILLFLIVCSCIGVIAWILISEKNSQPINNVEPVVRITNNDPCVQAIRNSVSQMWAYDPGAVPQKYWQMATEYANETIQTRIRGNCNGISFTCRVGQMRRDCDPCAVASGRQMAIDQHIADMATEKCGVAE